MWCMIFMHINHLPCPSLPFFKTEASLTYQRLLAKNVFEFSVHFRCLFWLPFSFTISFLKCGEQMQALTKTICTGEREGKLYHQQPDAAFNALKKKTIIEKPALWRGGIYQTMFFSETATIALGCSALAQIEPNAQLLKNQYDDLSKTTYFKTHRAILCTIVGSL